MNTKTLFGLIFTFLFTLNGCSSYRQRKIASISSSDQANEVRSIIDSLQNEILSKKNKLENGEEFFDMTAYLGTLYTSMYFLSLIWTNDFHQNKKYQQLANQHKDLLYKTQTKSGGWYRVLDLNLKEPTDITATVMNYWFLKAIGEDIHSKAMTKARTFIMNNGGLGKVDTLTKIFMSLFRNYDWGEIPKVPYLVFSKYSPFSDRQMGAWMSPHIIPIAILRRTEAKRDMGPAVSLAELRTNQKAITELKGKDLDKSDFNMIDKLISIQKPKGSYGSYVIASILGRMVVSYGNLYGKAESRFINSKKRAQDFLDRYLFDVGEANFLGATQDGHVWDTALLAGALLESGVSKNETELLLKRLVSMQNENGGFPFGFDFEETPDSDDTAAVVTTLSYVHQNDYRPIKKALNYLYSMQNKDGGYAAFSKDNNGNFILKFLTRDFNDTADIFDESSPDVTGHVLEALAKTGHTQDDPVVKKIFKYLRANQEKSGAFFGRWGINYIYGTSAVLAGVHAVGLKERDPLVQRSIHWLLSKQNEDGGFGEATLSYSSKLWEGRGVSTPSQTAWALIGLVSYLPAEHESIKKAVQFLITNFNQNNTFIDQSVTGTGHPNACYMVYPAYAKAFTLIALSRYLAKIEGRN